MSKTARACPPALFQAYIARAMAAGQSGQVTILWSGQVPPKEIKKLRRRIKAASNLELDKGVVWHSSGTFVAAIASWIDIIAVQANGFCYRFRLLAVDRRGQRTVYAIPVHMGKIKQLPGINYSADEIKLLFIIAGAISGSEAAYENTVELRHPAKADVQFQRDRWHQPVQFEKLRDLFRKRPWLLAVATAALDVQLRSYKLFRDGPFGVYNFTTSGNDVQADANFCAALRAMNFTAAPSFMGAAVPEIIVRERADLRAWRGCHDRIALIRTATGSLLTPLLDEIDERERLRSCGGILPPRLPTVPIVRCKAVLNRPFVVDVVLPKGEKPLSAVEQDILRSAMALAVNRKVAQAVYDRWRERMSASHAYRMDGFATWVEAIGTEFLRAAFASASQLRDQALELLSDSQAEQERAEQERAALITRALDLIGTPSRFEREIADRPQSKDEADQLLDSEQAVAFRFRLKKGNDAGKRLLVFSAKSLKRLLKRVGCGEELYDAVLAQAERLGMLDQRNRTVKFGQDSFTAVTFFGEKL